jgi:chromate reductase
MARTYRVGYFVGSLSSTSINRTLSKALVRLAPEDMEFTEISIGDLPLYNRDLEPDFPPQAAALKEGIGASDAVLFVTPEYNRSIPGALKNAIDWASRPWGQNSFDHMPAAVCGASPGQIGTALAQQSLRGVLSFCNARQMTAPECYVTMKPGLIDDDGAVNDDSTRDFLAGSCRSSASTPSGCSRSSRAADGRRPPQHGRGGPSPQATRTGHGRGPVTALSSPQGEGKMDEETTGGAGFLAAPKATPEVQRLYDEDLAGDGYVMNLTRVWAHLPEVQQLFQATLDQVTRSGSLTLRERGILVAATASALGDSYCSLSWGRRLAAAAGPAVAVSVLRGEDEGLDEAEGALADWARRITDDPNGTTAADVVALRAVGYDDARIVAITVYVALRLAFSTVNDALGALPDARLRDLVPPAVRDAVAYGRPLDEA